jgi:hypothetical protein
MPKDQVDTVVKRIMDSNINLNKLAKGADLTPEQVVKLVESTPELGEKALADALPEMAALSGLKGDAFVEWVNKLENTAPGLGNQLNAFNRSGGVGGAREAGNTAAQTWYADHPNATQEEKDAGGPQAYRDAYDNYLKEHLKNAGLLPG